MCNVHNEANVMLKKDKFDCDKVEERWGGSCGCTDDWFLSKKMKFFKIFD